MKKIDCHLHMGFDDEKQITTGDELMKNINAAGMDGAFVLSERPNSFLLDNIHPRTTKERLDHLFQLTDGHEDLYPFYWIDPMETTAIEQVDEAVARGVCGFKAICNHYYPSDARAMQVWTYIASKNKPILFHSGILYDFSADSEYNRPVNFEPLIFIKGLKFALAHISWPWCDELMGLYGKWNSAHAALGDKMAELFIDFTPGTPPIYREDALRKIFFIGFDDFEHFMFGVDNIANDYNVDYAKTWRERDEAIYAKFGLEQSIIDGVFGGTALKFIGKAK